MNNVTLVWITPNAEQQIMYCARVSNPANQDSTDTKLLNYCAKHGHWSVFEMASMCIEINTSRAIARQILRHRSFSFQEFSQRYAEVTDEMIFADARSQDHKNRQNSHDDLPEVIKRQWSMEQAIVYEQAMKVYERALADGIAKECARAVLPEGLTRSRMYMNGTIRSWMHYLKLRTGNGTQREHIEIAEQILAIVKQELPTIHKAITGG